MRKCVGIFQTRTVIAQHCILRLLGLKDRKVCFMHLLGGFSRACVADCSLCTASRSDSIMVIKAAALAPATKHGSYLSISVVNPGGVCVVLPSSMDDDLPLSRVGQRDLQSPIAARGVKRSRVSAVFGDRLNESGPLHTVLFFSGLSGRWSETSHCDAFSATLQARLGSVLPGSSSSALCSPGPLPYTLVGAGVMCGWQFLRKPWELRRSEASAGAQSEVRHALFFTASQISARIWCLGSNRVPCCQGCVRRDWLWQ